MDVRILTEAVGMADRRELFVLATVVWRRGPSSGQVGAKALIRPDGSIQGWLGGACAEPTVVREAQLAMADGLPRLLFLGQVDDFGAAQGMVTVPMACESEGAIQVYLEPVLPSPQVVAIGCSPAVFALSSLVAALGWELAVVDDGGVPAAHPFPELVRTSLDLSGLGIGQATAVVVATQGHYDDLALEAAVETDAGYIGLVASAKRAAGTLEVLRQRGVTSDQLQRVIAPAGLDLGPIENAEIGVAIVADLVARRAAGRLVASTAEPPTRLDVDPVCGMAVAAATARYRTRYQGVDFSFCGSGCKAAFDADPGSYVTS